MRGDKKKKPCIKNGYILNLVTYFDNRGFTKHYSAKIRNKKYDFSYARKMCRLISEFLSWIDPEIMPSLKEVDKVLKTINKEEQKQKT